MTAPCITKFSNELYLIKLDPSIDGFRNFIGVWLYKGDSVFIIDVGPGVTSNQLLKALRSLDVEILDYIFLTHIHMDHAGGIHQVAAAFPGTPIICHPKAIPHLVNTEMINEGTRIAIGDLGKAYGPMLPVSGDRLLNALEFNSGGIIPIATPGHSAHHLSYIKDGLLFAGEAGGVFFELERGVEYLRPATPPKFNLRKAVQSIDALIDKPHEYICYGHLGIRDHSREFLEKHKNQLLFWNDLISKEMAGNKVEADAQGILKILLESDPFVSGFSMMADDIKKREIFFMENSIRGFISGL